MAESIAGLTCFGRIIRSWPVFRRMVDPRFVIFSFESLKLRDWFDGESTSERERFCPF